MLKGTAIPLLSKPKTLRKMYDFRVLLLGPFPSPEIGSNLGPPNYGMLVLALVLLMHQQAIWHLRFSKFVMLRRRTTCSRAPCQEGKLSTTRGGQIFGLGLFFFLFLVRFWVPFLGPEMGPVFEPALLWLKAPGPNSGAKNGPQKRTQKFQKNCSGSALRCRRG